VLALKSLAIHVVYAVLVYLLAEWLDLSTAATAAAAFVAGGLAVITSQNLYFADEARFNDEPVVIDRVPPLPPRDREWS
jgi:hypothetical protein